MIYLAEQVSGYGEIAVLVIAALFVAALFGFGTGARRR